MGKRASQSNARRLLLGDYSAYFLLDLYLQLFKVRNEVKRFNTRRTRHDRFLRYAEENVHNAAMPKQDPST